MYRWKSVSMLGLWGVACVWTGCNGPLTPQATELLKNCYALYEAGDHDAASRDLNLFLRDNSRSSRADEGYYLRGLVRWRTGDPVGAGGDLNSALRKTSNKELRAEALVALGELAWEAGDLALAENTLRQALVYVEQGKQPSDQAHYRLGCVLQRQGRWKDSDVQFDRVVYLFGDAKLGKLAARRTHCSAWTIQVGAYEQKRHADLAIERLRTKKLQAARETILHDARPLFIVQVGRFPTYEQAAAALPATRLHAPDAFVTTTR